MSQPSLLHPQSTPPHQARPPSLKSGKPALGKSLKHAFSRRKRSGSFRNGQEDSDYSISSQRSRSIGPETPMNNDPSETRVSEEGSIDSTELSTHRGRSPSRRLSIQPPTASPPRRRSQSLPREQMTPLAPLPNASSGFTPSDQSPELPKDPKPSLSLQTFHTIPAMSITPATPINLPSPPSTPDKAAKSMLVSQRSRLNNSPSPSKEEKPATTSSSVGGAVWGSLVNAANKVTDTLSSLTNQNNPSTQMSRSVTPTHPPNDSSSSVNRPRSRTLPSNSPATVSGDDNEEGTPRRMAIDTLGEGELSLKALGFDSDTPNVPSSSGESNTQPRSVQEEIRDGGQEQCDFATKPLKQNTIDLAVPVEHKRTDSVGRSRRSLTVPSSGMDVANDIEHRFSINGIKPGRPNSLSKRRPAGPNESPASHASSEALVVDDVNRRARKRSSLVTSDGLLESPKAKHTGSPEVSEDRDNEDGLYIHGKDGKRRKPPIAGYAVLTGKRNRDFHALFKSIDKDDYLIEDYSCALSKEILVQGRMYVSEHYICFNSNIFGWVTNLVIPFTEVVSIEKRSTAVLFPNGIQITTLHSKYVFASFVGRDGTYDLLTSIWRLSHPDSRSLDDAHIDDSESPSAFISDEDGFLSEDEGNMNGASNVSEDGSDNENEAAKFAATATIPASGKIGAEADSGTATGDVGPENHEKTECDCGKDGHYDKVVCNEVIKAPLGKVWNCVFGDNKDFMLSFLRDNQKVLDIALGDWKNGNTVKRERQVNYIKPLNNSMGPKQTKCNITEQIHVQDFNSSCVALTITTTPDVPSGSSFQVMTKYCMTWAGGPATRLLITCAIEWSKSSWLKGAIEKGVNEGQISFARDLVLDLRKKLEGTAIEATRKASRKKGGKRKREEDKHEERADETKRDRAGALSRIRETLEGLNGITGSAIKPLFSSTCAICVLLIMVFYALIRVERTINKLSAITLSPSGQESSSGLPFGETEQNALWDWIDTRIGIVSKHERDGELIWNNLAREGDRSPELEEVEDAIRTTEGKLLALKEAVEKRKRRPT